MSGRIGVHAMSITPFDPSGALDEEALRAHLRFLGDANVGVYVASQGSGEGDLLSFDEKVAAYRIAAEELGGRVPVAAAGIGLAMSTTATRDLAVAACDAGVDAIQLLAPRPGPVRLRHDELERHFRTVIAAVGCEVQLSSNAVLAGYELPLEVVERLVDAHPSVRTVNVSDARPDALGAYVRTLVATFGDRIEVRVGMVREVVGMYGLGARGVLCFEPNVAPSVVTSVWAALEAGVEPDVGPLLRLNAALARGGNPRSLKAALAILGRGGGSLRGPYLPLEPEPRAELERDLHALGLV